MPTSVPFLLMIAYCLSYAVDGSRKIIVNSEQFMGLIELVSEYSTAIVNIQ